MRDLSAAVLNRRLSASEAPPAGFYREHRAALLVLGLLALFRLVYGATLGMAEDEMHYWQWSRHLALSYYDQGPGIAWCIRLGTAIFGPTPLGIRFVNIFLGIGTGWLTYLTVLRWTYRSAALWTLGLTTVAPLLAAGSVLATYDGPQVFFWAAALYALSRTVQQDRATGWYIVGLLVGMGLVCKLTMLLFAPSVLILLALSPRYRKWLSSPHPWFAFAIALALFTPVVLWNSQHGWMGFLHTIALGSRSRNAAPFRWFGDFLGGQAIALGPLLFLAELYAVVRLTRRTLLRVANGHPSPDWALTPDAAIFLMAFSAPILLLCLIVSLRSKMEINWPVPTHLMGLALVGCWFADVWNPGRFLSRAWICAAATLSALVTLIAFFPTIPAIFGVHVSAQVADKLNQTYGWDKIMAGVASARADLELEGKPVFVAGLNYRTDSALAFGLPDYPETYGLYFGSRRDQYFVWTDPSRLVGQNCLLCLDNRDDDAIAQASHYFDSVILVSEPTVTRHGFDGTIKHWYLYACRDFKGYDPNTTVDGY